MVIKISGLSWTGEFEVYGKTVHTFMYASDTKEKAKENIIKARLKSRDRKSVV